MKRLVSIIAIAGITLFIGFAIGYTTSENKRIAYEGAMATPGLLFDLARSKVNETCVAEKTNSVGVCNNIRLFNMHSYWDEADDLEKYVFVFSSSEKKQPNTRVYVAIGVRSTSEISIERGGLDLLDNGKMIE